MTADADRQHGDDPSAIMAEHGRIDTVAGNFCAECGGDAWPCLPYRLAERAERAEAALADAWDEGFTKAGRLLLGMDHENWLSLPNPYLRSSDA